MTGGKQRADFYLDVMGHDINNYNQILLAYLELLQESGGLRGEQEYFLERAIQATLNCAGIVNNVKAVQRVAQAKARPVDIDLDKLISGCIANVPHPAGKQVTIGYNPGRGRIVRALPEMKLAFCNALCQSINYSGDRLQIEVRIRKIIKDGRRLYTVSIMDDGNGIPDKVKQCILAEAPDEAALPQGRELRLHIADLLARASGGYMAIDDRVPGDYRQGTRITIALPAKEGS